MQLAQCNVYELYTKTSLTLDALVTQLECWFLEVSGFKVELASDIDMRARRPNFGRRCQLAWAGVVLNCNLKIIIKIVIILS